MTQTLNINAKFTATVSIFRHCVIITTQYLGNTRSTSFESVQDAIENTTIVSVRNFLQSL